MPGTAGTSLPVSWSAFMRVFTGANYSSTFRPLSGEGVWMWNDLPYALPSRLPKHTLVRAPRLSLLPVAPCAAWCAWCVRYADPV
ncbi:hypothetical protein EON62_04835 [archaeon]|nr:MAG: hypothetical protein EON62_04835 [archaeon]